jgi:hypothetical protein
MPRKVPLIRLAHYQSVGGNSLHSILPAAIAFSSACLQTWLNALVWLLRVFVFVNRHPQCITLVRLTIAFDADFELDEEIVHVKH